MLPSTWTLVTFWGFVAVIVLVCLRAYRQGEYRWWEGFVCLAIVVVLVIFLFPIYSMQRHREERAEWIRTHPHSKPLFED